MDRLVLNMENLPIVLERINVPLQNACEYGKTIGFSKTDVCVLRKLFGYSTDETTKNRRTEEEHEEWVRFYADGMECCEIARKYGVNANSIFCLLKSRGVYEHRKLWTQRQEMGLKNLLAKGYLVKDISPLIGRSVQSIYAKMRKLNLFKYNTRKRKKR